MSREVGKIYSPAQVDRCPSWEAVGDPVDRGLENRPLAATRDRMRITFASAQNGWLPLTAAVCITASSGCTSVISSAYLRDAWLDAVEHAAEPTPDENDSDTAASKRQSGRNASGSHDDADSSLDVDGTATDRDLNTDFDETSTASAWSPGTLEEAMDEADQRLAQSGGLSGAARDTLIGMLKSTPRQDWPVVIEEFTAALAAANPGNALTAVDAATPAVEPSQSTTEHAVPQAAAPAAARDVAKPTADAEPVAPLPPNTVHQPSAPEPDPKSAPLEPALPAFTVQNACFASRVQGWGVVDRFQTTTFSPGQELIVYFELDQLASRESAEGHATRVDTALRLVDGDGRRAHEWTFEPLEETCRGQRRDYFARYLVAVPAALPTGSYRLEIVVSDTIAGRTAHTSLPLDVAGSMNAVAD